MKTIECFVTYAQLGFMMLIDCIRSLYLGGRFYIITEMPFRETVEDLQHCHQSPFIRRVRGFFSLFFKNR